MTVKQLLHDHPHPDEDVIRHGIAGNLCRCTGYHKIVAAIKTAAGN
jgi:carbon-monoxide dehydrogenase small subunit